ncbi:unnamed protein product [Moneuplotes crassus]|uniref:Uncharacterized protein n=1 Tax=Euplotes crassus TaxID=5936 RepID=A0AAD1Y8T5_EUPCR|nr:unnamed protein product [Moneuplotes crassus]
MNLENVSLGDGQLNEAKSTRPKSSLQVAKKFLGEEEKVVEDSGSHAVRVSDLSFLKDHTEQVDFSCLNPDKKFSKLVNLLPLADEIDKCGFKSIKEYFIDIINLKLGHYNEAVKKAGETTNENLLGYIHKHVLSVMATKHSYEYLENSIREMELKQKQFQTDIKSMDNLIAKKANTITLNLHKQILDKNVHKTDRIDADLENYALKNTMLRLEDRLNEVSMKLNKLQAKLASDYHDKDHIGLILTNLKEYNIDTFVEIPKYEKRFTSVQEKFDEFKSNIKTFDSKLVGFLTDFTNSTKLQAIENKKLSKGLDLKVGEEYVTKVLENKIFGPIERFRKQVSEFYLENAQQKKIIQRFDEVITEKASKLVVEDLLLKSKECTESLKHDSTILDSLSSAVHEINNKLSTLSSTVGNLEGNIRNETESSLIKNFSNLKHELMSSGGTNTRAFHELRDELNNKASMSEVMAMMSFKCNVKDVEINMKITDVIHKQVQHLGVMIVEILRNEVSKYSHVKESEKTLQNKYNSLLSQSKNIFQWIQKFNPEDINTLDLECPEDLKKFSALISRSFPEINPNLHGINKVSINSMLPRNFDENIPGLNSPMMQDERNFYQKQKIKMAINEFGAKNDKIRKIKLKKDTMIRAIREKAKSRVHSHENSDSLRNVSKNSHHERDHNFKSPRYGLSLKNTIEMHSRNRSGMASPIKTSKNMKGICNNMTLPNI